MWPSLLTNHKASYINNLGPKEVNLETNLPMWWYGVINIPTEVHPELLQTHQSLRSMSSQNHTTTQGDFSEFCYIKNMDLSVHLKMAEKIYRLHEMMTTY